jgi:hypothetical protein
MAMSMNLKKAPPESIFLTALWLNIKLGGGALFLYCLDRYEAAHL